MSMWVILRNIGTVISFFTSLKNVVEGVAKTKSAPSTDMIKAVLEHAVDLLDKGVIDLPNVDEKAISDALKQIEAMLCKPT